MPGKDGLVHISELADYRVGKTTDVVKEGDKVKALLIGFDERGKIKLSMKRVNQETGEIIEVSEKPRRPKDGDDDRMVG
jgi:polyribonucleotide nucleotidyltransferase